MRTPLFMKTFRPYLKGRQSMGEAHYGPSEETLKTNIITVKRVGTSVACELLILARPS